MITQFEGVGAVSVDLHINNGILAERYEWQVSFGVSRYKSYEYDCYGGHCGGAVLIDDRWALTAAHCLGDVQHLFDANILRPLTSPARLHLAYGASLVAPEDQFVVDLVVRHPKYDPGTLRNDIAAVRVDRNVPATIALAASAPSAGASAAVLGWGHQYDGGRLSERLFGATVPMRSDADCDKQKWRRAVGDHAIMLAAGGVDPSGMPLSAGPCEFDSGGALFVGGRGQFELVGLASWTPRNCGEANGAPDMYVKISAYSTWIAATIAEHT